MSTYSFLPWLRRGIANEITKAAVAQSRATVDASVTATDGVSTTAPISRKFQLVGPGDITGLDSDAIVRTEPKNWVTDFEPNHLAFVEFYDEDFPWRYTPKGPESGGKRLLPWITLLVLKEDEFQRNRAPGRPLTSVILEAADPSVHFPPADQVWCWAHVHVSSDLGDGVVPDATSLDALLADQPDLASARVLSPRRLDPNAAYHAFLVPTFEVGRLAGLGEEFDDDATSGLTLSWEGGAEFPVYYEWFFRTAEAGDFEELVRRLEPRAVDPRVGVREMDMASPGFGTSGCDPTSPAAIVGLEGALRSPDTVPIPPDPSSTFSGEVCDIVNAVAEAQRSGDPDPVVAPPLYGRWHALTDQVSSDEGVVGWVDVLNRDARNRAAAGLGAGVIRTRQERYMRLAWEQIGEILAANKKITLTQFAALAAGALYQRTLEAVPPTRALTIAEPVFGRVLGSPTTVRAQLRASRLPGAMFSTALRKLLRPRGPLAMRSLPAGSRADALATLAEGMNEGRLSLDPPSPPVFGPTLEDVEQSAGSPAPAPTRATGLGILALVLLLVAMVVLILVRPLALAVALALVAIGGAVSLALRRSPGARAAGDSPLPGGADAADIAASPIPPGFGLGTPGEADRDVRPLTGTQAEAFRTELAAFTEMLATRTPVPEPGAAFSLENAHGKVLAALEPRAAFARRLSSTLTIGGQALDGYLTARYATPLVVTPFQRIVPVMAYPDIKDAMYRPLAEMGDELLVPNLGLVPPNTVSLMLTNEPFIEAYMVGLNDEFARELLFREFPTDQRGSPFRQFWDVRTVPGDEDTSEAERNEALKDIRPIHEWATSTSLGDHGRRSSASEEDRLVLVIRGDLLKRYPNTIIYAQDAVWGTDDRKNELILYDEDGARAAADVGDPRIHFPIFTAQVRPDLHFIGFDLTLSEARGDPDLEENAESRESIPEDQLGVYFVIQEIVGEARFGLDETRAEAPGERVWDNLAWSDLDLVGASMIDVDKPFTDSPAGSEDDGLEWGANAADMAAILYQKPAMVAIHARKMLSGDGPGETGGGDPDDG